MVEEAIKIPKFGTVCGVNGIDELVTLAREGRVNRIRPFSLEDVGEMLYRGGDDAWNFILSTNGFYTGERVVYTPEGILLMDINRSLFFRDPESTRKEIRLNASGAEFFLEPSMSGVFRRTGERERGKILRDGASDEKPPEKRSVYVLDCYGGFGVPAEELGSDGLTRWAFKEHAEFMGRFLKAKGINVLPFRFLDNRYLAQLKQGYHGSDKSRFKNFYEDRSGYLYGNMSGNPSSEIDPLDEGDSKAYISSVVRPIGIGFPIEDRGEENKRIAIIGNQGYFPDSIPVYFLKEARSQQSIRSVV